MYSHIVVRLKAKHNAKPQDCLRMRQELDQLAERDLKSTVSQVLTFDAPTAFAWKLAHSIDNPLLIPDEIKNALEENKNVELFSAAVATPEEESNVTLDVIEKTFLRMRDDMNHEDYDVYALKLRPSRGCDVNVRELSTTLRDRVENLMETVGRFAERSFTAKKRFEEAMAEARTKLGPNATEAELKSAASPRCVTISLDLFKGQGFWSRTQHEGGVTLNKSGPRHGLKTTGALSVTVDSRGNETVLSVPYFGEIGDRVLVLKIGEIFLKRGNRGRFMTQLQNNIQFKLHGLARVVRVNHLFVVMPISNQRNDRKRKESIGKPSKTPQGIVADEYFNSTSEDAMSAANQKENEEDGSELVEPAPPFSDEDLAKVIEVCAGIPGVESVVPALRALPDKSSILRSMQYLLTLAGTSNQNIPAFARAYPDGKIPSAIPAFGSLTSIPLKGRVAAHAAASTLSKLSSAPAPPAPGSDYAKSTASKAKDESVEKKSVEDEELPFDVDAQFVKGLVDITQLGFKLDVHLHQPCPFKSRSMLARDLQITHRQQLTDMMKKGGYNSLAEASTVDNPHGIAESKSSEFDDSDDEFASIRTNYQGSFFSARSHIHIRVEVLADVSLLSFIDGSDIVNGVGGQPTGTTADSCHTVVSLLSGGMDSPVAAFRMMVRGMRVVFVHFQNANVSDEDTVREKIVKLADHLSRYQIVTYLHIVPFASIQDAIITQVPGPARMLVYRRFMMQVAARVAMKYGGRFLVVGDSIGQVASQTAPNLYASYTNTPLPILSPLIGSNKKEIMEEARKIGTYDISALPYGDCCSYFLAKHPVTNIKMEQLREYEAAVGNHVEGGALRLIREAFNASAVLRWHRPSDGAVTLRSMRPVFSQYREIVEEMLQSCPTRANDIDEMDEEAVAKAVAQIAEIEERAKQSAAAALGEKRKHVGDEEAKPAESNGEESLSKSLMSDSKAAEATAVKHRRRGNRQQNEENYDDNEDFDLAQNALLREHKFLESTRSTLTAEASSVDTSANPSVITKKIRLDSQPEQTSYLLVSNITADAPEVEIPSPMKAIDIEQKTIDGSHDTDIAPFSYFDNAATTPLLPQVLEAMLPYLAGTHFGNSSSTHAIGAASTAAVEESRRVLLGALNATPECELSTRSSSNGALQKQFPMIFTSGGTESNNLAVFGAVRAAIDDAVSNITESESGEAVQPTTLRVHLITSSMEHNATLEPLEQVTKTAFYSAVNANLRVEVELTHLRNNTSGIVDVKHLDYLLHADSQFRTTGPNAKQAKNGVNPRVVHVLTYVSIMHANNEIGVVQPLAKLGALCGQYKQTSLPVLFHTDACQTFGKLFIDVNESKLDLVTINGHKLHGPKGVGALYVRPGTLLTAQTLGGHHEGNYRSGTLNVPGIVGLATAAAHMYVIDTPFLKGKSGISSLIAPPTSNTPIAPVARGIKLLPTSYLIPNQSNRNIVENMKALYLALNASFPRVPQNGPSIGNPDALPTFEEMLNEPASRLPNLISVVLDKTSKMDSTAMIKFLSARGVYVSSGSACANNAEPKPSHVLSAINVKSEFALSSIRLSVGSMTTVKEVNRAAKAFAELAEHMKGMK